MAFIYVVHSRNAQLPREESRITRERHQALNDSTEPVFWAIVSEHETKGE